MTAADGTYALPRVPAGSYELSVPAPPAGHTVPAAVMVTVRPSTGPGLTTSTDAEGTFGLGGLVPGSYTVAVTPPAGSGGTTSRPVVITSAGESITGLDFTLATTPAVVVPVVPAPDDSAPDAPDDTSDDSGTEPRREGALPDTGGPSRSVPLLGLLLVAAGTATTAASRVRRL